MFYLACWWPDRSSFCLLCCTVLFLIECVQTQGDAISIHLLDAKNKIVLIVTVYTKEKLVILYEMLKERNTRFSCLTYEGFFLNSSHTFEDYRIEKNIEIFKVETKTCEHPLIPDEYLRIRYKGVTTSAEIPLYPSEAAFAQKILWIVLLIVTIAIASSATYYMYVTRRGRQIEEEKKEIREGRRKTSSTSSTRSLSSRRALANVLPPPVDVPEVIIVEPDIAKIESEEEVSDTGTSSSEARKIRKIPTDVNVA
ncbi:hypothetical protein RB195_020133 [Necator americanus]|uniref:Ubiquitin-like domain-containing protein n=1 Tax=Necator americanus TaxID=51031 RepID=A0ABR1CIS0_NECAM